MDRAEAALTAGGRPLDVADHRRLHPAASGPLPHRGPAPPLGETTGAGATDPGPGPARISPPPAEDCSAGQRTETQPTRTRPATRSHQPTPPTDTTPSTTTSAR